jgi:hypothetical protein
MGKTLFLAIAMTSIALTAWAAEKGSTTNPYMGAEVVLGESDNGATVNYEVLKRMPELVWTTPTIEQPAEGIWTFGGYGLAPISAIDTPEGLKPTADPRITQRQVISHMEHVIEFSDIGDQNWCSIGRDAKEGLDGTQAVWL